MEGDDNGLGYWDVCCNCEKRLETRYHYYNHYDGEDHDDIDDDQMDLDDFIEEIESAYEDAERRSFDSIVIAIDTDLDNTYYINDTEEGFQCDVFDYVFDDLYSIASQLYNELRGNVTEIRIE